MNYTSSKQSTGLTALPPWRSRLLFSLMLAGLFLLAPTALLPSLILDRLGTDTEDLRLFVELGGGGAPVRMLGSSSGAIVALDFLATHPELGTTVIAHAPPYA